MMSEPPEEEASRLEALWAGRFGEEYVDRNRSAARNRGPFWESLLTRHPPQRVLEVGCNVGANIEWIVRHVQPENVWGVDINEQALGELAARLPAVRTVRTAARGLPFASDWFDLVFTAGVLIHQPEDSLEAVMQEIVRCSRRHVLCLEYFSAATVEVPYRGQSGALFKRDYGGIYSRLFPVLSLLERGELTRQMGWDDVSYWLFEKQRGARRLDV